MEVKVKWLAARRASIPLQALSVALPDGATVGALLEVLRETGEANALANGPTVVLVDRSSTTDETPLKDGDEVLILQPLGGG